jgi:hypothetical protein
MGRKNQHRFHGDPERFEIMAQFIFDRYGSRVHYIADVAGGQGMLSRILNKQYHYHSEVIDPKGSAILGVPNRKAEFSPDLAGFYDLVIGLHPDQATRAVAEAALFRPVVLVPCCNFWSEEKLGRDELVEAIERYYDGCGVHYERVIFPFKGPKNIGIISEPPGAQRGS